MSTVIGLAALGACIGIGMIFSSYITGISRQPKSQGTLFTQALISIALIEGTFFIAIVLAAITK